MASNIHEVTLKCQALFLLSLYPLHKPLVLLVED